MTRSFDAGATYPPPSRRRWPIRLLIAVLVLIVLLLAVDRVGDFAAEKVAATTLRNSQDLRSDPDVDIGGFPFLTQFATGHYDQITVGADDVPIGNSDVSVDLSRLKIVLDDLTVSRGFDDFHAESAHGVGTIGYDQLSDVFGIDLSYAGNGRVRFSTTLPIVGRVGFTASPGLVNGALTFVKGQINGGINIGGSVADVLQRVFNVTLPFDNLPFDIDVQKLQLTAAGLQVDLAGSDLTYKR